MASLFAAGQAFSARLAVAMLGDSDAAARDGRRAKGKKKPPPVTQSLPTLSRVGFAIRIRIAHGIFAVVMFRSHDSACRIAA